MHDVRKKVGLAVVSCLMAAGITTASVGAQAATPVTDDSTPVSVDSGACLVSPEDNVALVESLYAAISAGDADAIDAILADDLVQDLHRYGLDDDDTTNSDEIALMAAQAKYYPGATTTITDIFGAGDQVVAATTLTISEYNITGEDVVLANPLEVDGITIFTVECGEIVSMHGVTDELGLLTGLGIIPPLTVEP